MPMFDLDVMPDLIARLLASPGHDVLLVLLAAAAVIDWRTSRIPNWLTLGGLAIGLAYNAVAHGFQAGLLPALAGAAAGLVLLLPMYALRIMGAGDVKLMAMVGAFLGISQIAFAVICTFIAGGVAAVAFALYHRSARRMAGNVGEIVQSMAFAALVGARPEASLAQRASVGKLPYAVSIAAGTLAWLLAGLAGLA
jgi:prepilin peptidase CpaA